MARTAPMIGFSLMIACLLGCENTAGPPADNQDLFAATQMRIHPSFTQIVSLNPSPVPNGIEAQLEFSDRFNDSTKASGKVVFELFDYRRDSPDPRGKRLHDPWLGSLDTPAEQTARWNTTLRTYRFELPDPTINPRQSYVLTATFERTGGGRFPLSSVVLVPRPVEPKPPAGVTETPPHTESPIPLTGGPPPIRP